MFKSFGLLHKKIIGKINEKTYASNDELEEFTSQIINKINLNLNKFSYNVIVANLHEIYHYFNKLIEEQKNYLNLIDNYRKILTIMLPILPHLASECLKESGYNKEHIMARSTKKIS